MQFGMVAYDVATWQEYVSLLSTVWVVSLYCSHDTGTCFYPLWFFKIQ